MKIFTLLTLVIALSFSTAERCSAQSANRYKLVFAQSLTVEAKAYLDKLSNKAEVQYNDDNSVVISTSLNLDLNILSGKFCKLVTPIKTLELLKNEVTPMVTEKTPISNQDKEIQDKATKSQQLQIERQNKSSSSSFYRR